MSSRSQRRTTSPRAIALLGGPLIIVVLVLLVWPLGITVMRSLTNESGLTLSRYVEIATDQHYLESIAFTAILSIISTVLALIICVPAGLYLQRDTSVFGSFLATILTIPLSLPGIIIGFFIILMVGNAGVIPKAIEGLTGDRALQVAYTYTGLLLGYLYFQIPRVVLVVRGAADLVTQETIDVARSLGSSTWAVYFRVILPALRPALLEASIIAMATGFGAYGTAATLSRGIRVMPLEVASSFTESFDPGMASALAVVLAAITMTLLILLGRFGEKRVAS